MTNEQPVIYRGAGAPLLPRPVTNETAEWFVNTVLKGATMTNETELRERIERVILGRTAPQAAQAIIDEFGLTTEERLTEFGIDDPEYQERVVGKWEET